MILGFDHLALSVIDIQLAKKDLETKNFNCIFFEKNVMNHPEKQLLLNHYQASHDIALFRKSSSSVSNCAIEITAHGHISNLSKGVYSYHNNYIQLETDNLEKEKLFWLNAFGFQEKESNFIEFPGFIPHWSCKIKLNQVAQTSPYTLDSTGYTCVALLTNNLKEDRIKVGQFGAKDITNSFEISVNNQNLDIVMFRTPTGAICELIQIKRGKQ
jgi:hypothetical protein